MATYTHKHEVLKRQLQISLFRGAGGLLYIRGGYVPCCVKVSISDRHDIAGDWKRVGA